MKQGNFAYSIPSLSLSEAPKAYFPLAKERPQIAHFLRGNIIYDRTDRSNLPVIVLDISRPLFFILSSLGGFFLSTQRAPYNIVCTSFELLFVDFLPRLPITS